MIDEAERAEAQIKAQVVLEMIYPNDIFKRWRKKRGSQYYLNCTSDLD